MKRCLLILLAGSFISTGCVSKSRARAETRSAYQQGLLDAQRQLSQNNQAPTVLVRGDVRKAIIPWSDELTLSRALVAAEYRGITTPREIIVLRQGQPHHVNPKQLLNGAEDPVLEPGDVIEIVR